MKKALMKIISVIMCLTLIFTCISTGASAASPNTEAVTVEQSADAIGDLLPVPSIKVPTEIFAGMEKITSFDAFLNNALKVCFNMLNVLCEGIFKGLCKLTPDPKDWTPIEEYNSEDVCFLKGRETYATTVKRGNFWSLGYSSRSIVPEDIGEGRYYIGRDVSPRIAKGVYDDNRIRVAVIDDNSGEGAVVFGAIDSLGVTSTDIRSIRKGVLDYCKANGIKVASINISATHSHTALDTQGVGTAFFYKLFLGGLNNRLGFIYDAPFLKDSKRFNNHFINESIRAIEEAFENVEPGKLYFDSIDAGKYMKDKRGLITKEDLPEIASLYFVPTDRNSQATYIADIGCHPTSFGAGNLLVSGDYIYYLDKYIKETANANSIVVPGALGQITRDNLEYSEEGLSEYEAMGEESKCYGETFGKLILSGNYETELSPVLNVKHKEVWLEPDNSLLVLACEIKLVNNKVYIKPDGTPVMASEMGYLEFGNKVGFALFPSELYPEVFWGTEITGDVSWDGESWDYGSLHESVDGVKVYPVSLTNDATGYVVPDNYFAFMGHIAGVDRQVADELLSVGKHIGSYLVEEYLDLADNLN